MIEKVLDLRKEGTEQPQFFALRFRLQNQGEGYNHTTAHGTEAYLRREVLTKGGIPGNIIDELFKHAK